MTLIQQHSSKQDRDIRRKNIQQLRWRGQNNFTQPNLNNHLRPHIQPKIVVLNVSLPVQDQVSHNFHSEEKCFHQTQKSLGEIRSSAMGRSHLIHLFWSKKLFTSILGSWSWLRGGLDAARSSTTLLLPSNTCQDHAWACSSFKAITLSVTLNSSRSSLWGNEHDVLWTLTTYLWNIFHKNREISILMMKKKQQG